MNLNLFHFGRHATPSERCIAQVGIGVVCGRESTHGESLCDFHRTLEGPWLKAATHRAA